MVGLLVLCSDGLEWVRCVHSLGSVVVDEESVVAPRDRDGSAVVCCRLALEQERPLVPLLHLVTLRRLRQNRFLCRLQILRHMYMNYRVVHILVHCNSKVLNSLGYKLTEHVEVSLRNSEAVVVAGVAADHHEISGNARSSVAVLAHVTHREGGRVVRDLPATRVLCKPKRTAACDR